MLGSNCGHIPARAFNYVRKVKGTRLPRAVLRHTSTCWMASRARQLFPSDGHLVRVQTFSSPQRLYDF